MKLTTGVPKDRSALYLDVPDTSPDPRIGFRGIPAFPVGITGMVPALQQYFCLGLSSNGKIAIRSEIFTTQFLEFFVFHRLTFFLIIE